MLCFWDLLGKPRPSGRHCSRSYEDCAEDTRRFMTQAAIHVQVWHRHLSTLSTSSSAERRRERSRSCCKLLWEACCFRQYRQFILYSSRQPRHGWIVGHSKTADDGKLATQSFAYQETANPSGLAAFDIPGLDIEPTVCAVQARGMSKNILGRGKGDRKREEGNFQSLQKAATQRITQVQEGSLSIVGKRYLDAVKVPESCNGSSRQAVELYRESAGIFT